MKYKISVFLFIFLFFNASANSSLIVKTFNTIKKPPILFKTRSGVHINGIKNIQKYNIYSSVYQSKININKLATKLRYQGRVSSIKQANLIVKNYKKLHPDGSYFLSLCVKKSSCDPQKFFINLTRSPLHQTIAIRAPHLNPTQVNILAGELNERVMVKYFKGSGWTQIHGEIGRNGIDGLFIKKNKSGVISDVLFAEAKYNFSPLGNTIHGTQMSKEWLHKKVTNLIKKTNNKQYNQILSHLNNNTYRSTLWRLKINEGRYINIQRKNIISDSNKLSLINYPGTQKMLIDRKENQYIDLLSPKNDFQINFSKIFEHELSFIIK